MKTIYFKKLKSGNYEISNKDNFDLKANSKKSLQECFAKIENETSNVFDKFYAKFKKARIIKATYRKTQTYFSSFNDLLKYSEIS